MANRAKKMTVRLIIPAMFLAVASFAAHIDHVDPHKEQCEARYYRIEPIEIPTNIVLEVGGMDFLPDGRLLIATRRGEIWSLLNREWKRFASGLDEPMGLCILGSNRIAVAQRPELTAITDTDADGRADVFETSSNDWNDSGHITTGKKFRQRRQAPNLSGIGSRVSARWILKWLESPRQYHDDASMPVLLKSPRNRGHDRLSVQFENRRTGKEIASREKRCLR